MKIQSNVSLKHYNTFGIDAIAKYFTEISTVEELRDLVNSEIYTSNPKLILGGGSNLLFTQNFDGLVIKINIKGIEKIQEDDSSVKIKVGAGEPWHSLVIQCIREGYAGIENLSLIPGTVGAAPMQNIGAYGVEIKEVFDNLEAMDRVTGETKLFKKEDCAFGYRQSVFKNELKGKYIITSVTFKLSKQPVYNVSYGAIVDTLKTMGISDLTVQAISDAVIKIRQSKLPDPAIIGNAGSFFKNPEISEIDFNRLKTSYPLIPGYNTDAGYVKVPAGWLIEQAGWKGKRVGDTGVHKDQALVLVNYGNAKGKEVEVLAYEIQSSVKQKFGVDIIPEVNII